MKVTVKILQGQECSVEIEASDTVDSLKQMVADQLNIAPRNQRILFRGKTLQEGTSIKEYNLTEGAKLHLAVKKEGSAGKSELETGANKLEEELFKQMRKSFKSDDDTRKVVVAFMKSFEKRMLALSLDDIERICERWNRDNQLSF